MSEQTVIDGLVAVLQATDGFTETDTGAATADDHRVLTGGIDRAAIVLSNAFSQTLLSESGITQVSYTLDLGLYIRHTDEVSKMRQDMRLYTQNIIAAVNADPTLSGAAADCIVSAGHVEDEKLVIGGVAFGQMLLTVVATEYLTTT